ncbi:hypothetical protein SynMEDNS5_01873 [Synechococcus sp. MEDNS5]|nr:hypothetical protein [Synechococcus sp. MEDNS5]QNJ06587.1 hypothetical protein SynMEDNS5_01873 [Synechococcus sp. MEDNS5]|tara:strand:+ start:473 stop:607 length:135 start_codon:yes stop_codon:yes gene_type:complete
MQWQTNGELDRNDLFELVRTLRDVESPNHSNELWRLGTKYDEAS